MLQPESLWVRIVASIYDGEPGTLRFGRESRDWSVWRDAMKGAGELEGLGVNLSESLRQQVAMGNQT